MISLALRFALICLMVFVTACTTVSKKEKNCTRDAKGDYTCEAKAYGNYFAKQEPLKGTPLKMRYVITVGEERLPKDYLFSAKEKEHLASNKESHFWDPYVHEIYLANPTDAPVTISKLAYVRKVVLPGESDALPFSFTCRAATSITIPPHEIVVTDPVVELDSTYALEKRFTLQYTVSGQNYAYDNVLQRLEKTKIDQTGWDKEFTAGAAVKAKPACRK